MPKILERFDRAAAVASQIYDQASHFADVAAEGVELIGIVEEPRKLKNTHVAKIRKLRCRSRGAGFTLSATM
jgi:hypothetical protein